MRATATRKILCFQEKARDSSIQGLTIAYFEYSFSRSCSSVLSFSQGEIQSVAVRCVEFEPHNDSSIISKANLVKHRIRFLRK